MECYIYVTLEIEMIRKRLIRTDQHFYHVTTRTKNREWFTVPMPILWQLCQESLAEANTSYPIELSSFVLMHNHYHMLLKTPASNLDLFMCHLNRILSLKISNQTKSYNYQFNGRYKWCIIRSKKYFYNCYRYIYQNPIRAGITNKCEYYPYSTLSHIVHNKHFPIRIYDRFCPKDQHGLIQLNKPINEIDREMIRKGLSLSDL